MKDQTESYDDGDVLAAYPRADIDRDNLEHYRGLLQRRLLLNRCADCRMWSAPPRGLCPHCWSDHVEPSEVSGRGIVHLTTRFHFGVADDGVDYSSPLRIVTVDLEEQDGLRFTAGVSEESTEVAIGDAVSISWITRAGAPAVAFALDSVDHSQRTNS